MGCHKPSMPVRTDIEVRGRCQVCIRAVEAGVSLPGDGSELCDLELAGRQPAVQLDGACVSGVRKQLQLVGEHGSLGALLKRFEPGMPPVGHGRASSEVHAESEPTCTLLSCPTLRAHDSIARGIGQVDCAAARGGLGYGAREVLCDLDSVLLRMKS